MQGAAENTWGDVGVAWSDVTLVLSRVVDCPDCSSVWTYSQPVPTACLKAPVLAIVDDMLV